MYISEYNRNKLSHRIDMGTFGGYQYSMFFTDIGNEAMRKDRKAGYEHGGPRLGIEVEHAEEYADYVMDCVVDGGVDFNPSSVYSFATSNYFFLSEEITN